MNITNTPFNLKKYYKLSTCSTNDDAKTLLKHGISSPVLIISECQTNGKGRSGKSFLSPEGGLYFSLAFNCSLPLDSSYQVTSCTAVAVCRVLNKYNIFPGIKWVNDIYYGGKKLAGILVEAVNDYNLNQTSGLVVGIGINVSVTPNLTGDYKAISLHDIGLIIDKNVLACEIAYEILEMQKNDFCLEAVYDEYKSLSICIGKTVEFSINGVKYKGTVLDIEQNGGLLVKTITQTLTITSGEISFI